MSTVLLPLAATAAAAGLTYWCCVRPMRRSRSGEASASPGCCAPGAAEADLDGQIAAARVELDQLRAATSTQVRPSTQIKETVESSAQPRQPS